MTIGNENDTTSTGGTLLSSVDIHAQKIGFVAASVLARLIGGETVPDKTLVAPSELIVRKSSDITIHLNPNIEKAIDFLHENLHENIEVEDIVRQQNLCRRSLEMNFKAQFNQSPMQYLRAMRLEKVRNLLRTTDLSVTEIGRQCGIPDINYLCRLFRKLYQTTPLNYREQY